MFYTIDDVTNDITMYLTTFNNNTISIGSKSFHLKFTV